MKIGLPKEIKDNEYRVGLTPAGVNALVNAGHAVSVQKTAGEGSGFADEQYVKAGGKILETADEIWVEG
ncbi:MAG: alanine dehydrogenase, partial [Blastocatellia bacterium]|nr:alanine dehydrogenase [Blastocatellia bacterium]